VVRSAFSESFTAGKSVGFSLATSRTQLGSPASIIEVYPHPALLYLTGEEKRLPYKVSKIRSYYPNATPEQRRGALVETWRTILVALERAVAGASRLLDGWEALPLSRLKSVEDTLDALISAWVGAEFMRGRATAYGDETAAIWIPQAGLAKRASS
jgi:predicted RNase H-like nuclease